MNATMPFAGKRVAIVHPAWHSCGTYSVVVGQADAYRCLGAQVETIAFSDVPGLVPQRAWLWRDYRANTPELDRQPRHFVGLPLARVGDPRFLANAVVPYLHGDQAAMRTGAAEAARFDKTLAGADFDLVHCNHFFCMPVARRLSRQGGARAPIVLDTHDLQAGQFDIINDARLILPPRTTHAAMLERELREMRDAAALLHLNAEEDRSFHSLLPGAPHHLLYPPVPDVPTGPGGADILLVSSWNAANLDSMLWFLREVMPRAGDPPIRIAGNIDAGVRAKDRALHDRYRDSFLGRVNDLGGLYAAARLVLLPTTAGTGLSIKTVEAMASGLPLIASPLAFRGMDVVPAALRGVTIAETAEAFAAALAEAATRERPTPARRAASETRRLYEASFSAAAYAGNLAAIVAPLLARGVTTST